jgi:hypothetical protein
MGVRTNEISHVERATGVLVLVNFLGFAGVRVG